MLIQTLSNFAGDMGILNMDIRSGIMILVAIIFLYLAIRKGFEPLLLVPIAFGMLLSNMPMAGMFMPHADGLAIEQMGLLTVFYQLKPVLPSLIFLGVGAMTDFGPLIANPKSLLMGAAAQLGIFFAFFAAIFLGFNAQEAASIGIIGGADGPTAIYTTCSSPGYRGRCAFVSLPRLLFVGGVVCFSFTHYPLFSFQGTNILSLYTRCFFFNSIMSEFVPNKMEMVENRRLELLTPCVQSRCSPN